MSSLAAMLRDVFLWLFVIEKRSDPKDCMGIIFQQGDILELDGFPLERGDEVEILLLDSQVSGIIVHSEWGWYILTTERMAIGLETGLNARLLSLSSETSPQSDARLNTLGKTSPWSGNSAVTRLPNSNFVGTRTKTPMPRKYSLLAAPDATRK